MADAPPGPGQGLPGHELAYLAELKEKAGARSAGFARLHARALARFRSSQTPDHGLTEAEKVAIYEYTTDEQFIAAFNGLLREAPHVAMDMHGGFIATLSAALNKLPSHTGRVWRGSGLLPQAVMDKLIQKGTIYSPGYFWSTASDKRGLKGYPEEIVFDIQSRIGKNVARMSAKEKDYEVLFPLGAAFRVEAADLLANGTWEIRLANVGKANEEG